MEALEKAVRALQRDIHKIRQKLDDPTGEKAKARSENNSFKRPQQVSDELRKFLGLAEGEMVSRSDVTKRVFAYAKERGLNNGKVINVDDALKSLLNPVDGQDVTVTNLQKYINHHYKKAVPAGGGDTPSTEPKSKKPKVVKT